MSDLSGSERRKLERLLGMGSGYVLNFSDRTFGDFFDEYRVEIDAERYRARGTSKANRMRTYWELDANHVVGRVIGGLIDYATDKRCFGDSNPLLIEDCRKIAQRLLSDQPVAELATVKAKAEAADQARKEASAAREEAARLAGQLQAHQEQTAAILARLAPPATEEKPATRKK